MALAQIHLLAIQRPWSALTWVLVGLVPVAFAFGGLVGRARVQPWLAGWREARKIPTASGRLRVLLLGCLALGYLELAHQLIGAGAVPLLSGNIDRARFAAPGGPTIVLVDLLTVAAIVALTIPRRLTARKALPELAVVVVAMVGLALQAGRGSIVLPFAVGFFTRSLFWGLPRLRNVVVLAVVLTAAISGVFFVRTAQHEGNPFEHELYHQVLPGLPAALRPLVPIDLAIATNFEALARVVDYFPSGSGYGYGAYDVQAFHSVIPGARSLPAISGRLSPPWVTSTAAGPLWADGGPIVTLLGLGLVGGLCVSAFTLAVRTRTFRHALVAGYLLYLALFCVYTDLFTQQPDWLIVAPLLLVVGALAENPRDPPGIVGVARSRLDSLRRSAALTEAKTGAELPALPGARAGTDVTREASHAGSRKPMVITGVLAASLVVAALIVQGASPRATPLSAPPTFVVKFVGLPATTQLRPGDPLFSDDDLPGADVALLALGSNGQGRELEQISVGADGRATVHTQPFGLVVSPRASVSAGHWTSSGVSRSALFLTQSVRRGASVRVVSLDGTRTLARGFAPLGPGPSATSRVFAIATWSGSEPDLFVIDPGLSFRPLRMRIFSGVSGFRRQVLDLRLGFGGFDPRVWSVFVARATAGRPDLVLIKRLRSPGGFEVHALSGKSRFTRFVWHQSLKIPSTVGAAVRFAVGRTAGVPTVYGVVQRRGGSPSGLVLVALPISA